MSTITVTGALGPGETLTALVFNDVTDLDFQLDRGVLQITSGIPSKITHISLSTIATVTYTIAGTVATVTVST